MNAKRSESLDIAPNPTDAKILRIPYFALILTTVIASSPFVDAFIFSTLRSSVRCSRPVCHGSFINGVQSNPSDMDRRDFISSFFGAAVLSCGMIAQPVISEAADTEMGQSNTTSITILRGLVMLKSGTEPNASPSAALYITVKPETSNNAPKEIVNLFGGRPPPVLTARFPVSSRNDSTDHNVLGDGRITFPFYFQLTESDMTAEGVFKGKNDEKYASNQYWWSNDNLIVSARLDFDGVAATRDPDDLVGRSIIFVQEKANRELKDAQVRITLQGRGIGGKFITAKKEML
ncbi:hypothetical protein ACHAWX_001038 [Stephanocyclus meneghinianus]